MIIAKNKPLNLEEKTVDSVSFRRSRTEGLLFSVYENRLQGQIAVQHQQVGGPARLDRSGLQTDALPWAITPASRPAARAGAVEAA